MKTTTTTLGIIILLLALAAPASAQGGGTPSVTDQQAQRTEASRHVPVSDIARAIGADDLHALGYTGDGVGVALIDSGVSPVGPLADASITFGPDLSFESQIDGYRHLDTFGHGTHMASLIVGHGLAPDADLISIKVAANDGAVDVTQVIAAVDWVTQHADEHNIRVLNLSYGTQGEQHHLIDPLVHAVEQARRAGIVVVVAVGNESFGSPAVNTPATHPGVVAVGASDLLGTDAAADDIVSPFSSHGTLERRPTLVTPGTSVLGARVPGSTLDEAFPEARVDDTHFAGSGSSQSAALTSGAIALLLQARPLMTPADILAVLSSTADPMPADPRGAGAGRLNVSAALTAVNLPTLREDSHDTTGTGTLDATRAGTQLVWEGVTLSGERDIFGQDWDAHGWAQQSTARSAWDGGDFLGVTYAGGCLCDSAAGFDAWEDVRWHADSWIGERWIRSSGSSAGRSWSGSSWSGSSWSGSSWSGNSWSGNSWSGSSWSGNSWSGNSWSTGFWA